jgi:predicted Zn-dependent protease with MMP-like domain
VLDIPPEEFEDLVAEALDGIPDELARLVDNVVFVVEDDSDGERGLLLGLYEGVPLTSRGTWYAGAMPDRITIYRNPILSICRGYDEVVEQVRVTVVHEIAHHFGIDDDRLHELGYG